MARRWTEEDGLESRDMLQEPKQWFSVAPGSIALSMQNVRNAQICGHTPEAYSRPQVSGSKVHSLGLRPIRLSSLVDLAICPNVSVAIISTYRPDPKATARPARRQKFPVYFQYTFSGGKPQSFQLPSTWCLRVPKRSTKYTYLIVSRNNQRNKQVSIMLVDHRWRAIRVQIISWPGRAHQ